MRETGKERIRHEGNPHLRDSSFLPPPGPALLRTLHVFKRRELQFITYITLLRILRGNVSRYREIENGFCFLMEK